LENLLNVLNNTFRVSPVICGHSLGGSLAQKTAVYFHDKVGPVFAFSSPKVSKADAQKWASIPNEEKSPLWVTNTKGDSIVARAGSACIGTWIVVNNPHAKTTSQRHGQTVLNQKDIVLEGAAPIKPRSSRMQKIIELIQMILSLIFIEPFHKIYLQQRYFGSINNS
jgi:pimeloyl-ACP methyl ester carboxylesterase